jgi:hypothetical protein
MINNGSIQGRKGINDKNFMPVYSFRNDCITALRKKS